jgi:hypothetical protein
MDEREGTAMASTMVAGRQSPALRRGRDGWRLWSAWTVANGAGELVGLGIAGLIGIALVRGVEATLGAGAPLATAAIMIGAGTLEGAIVGVAQWLALRGPFPAIGRRGWVGATALGAALAWTLGMLPSTLLSLGGDAGSPPPPGMAAPLFFVLAAGLGVALGPFLGVPQWLILRRHAAGAGLWIPANMLAWGLGMPVVFAAAGNVPEGWPLAAIAALVLATAGAAGAVVGAVHGLALVRLARARRPWRGKG